MAPGNPIREFREGDDDACVCVRAQVAADRAPGTDVAAAVVVVVVASSAFWINCYCLHIRLSGARDPSKSISRWFATTYFDDDAHLDAHDRRGKV